MATQERGEQTERLSVGCLTHSRDMSASSHSLLTLGVWVSVLQCLCSQHWTRQVSAWFWSSWMNSLIHFSGLKIEVLGENEVNIQDKNWVSSKCELTHFYRVLYLDLFFRVSNTRVSVSLLPKGLPLHHPRGQAEGGWKLPAPGRCSHAEPSPPFQERPHLTNAWDDGKSLPWNGTCHAFHARTNSLPTCHWWGRLVLGICGDF